MHLIKLLTVSTILAATVAVAQTPQELENCQTLISAAEEEDNPEVYVECGFNEPHTALTYWAPLAERNEWPKALYQIYKTHNTFPVVKGYLYKAAQLGYTPAIVAVGDEFFDQGKIPEAMRYYNAAVRADLDEETQGKITGRLALLYADPKSSYYDMKKALPLLQKASLQRHALSNNVLGTLSLFGRDGMPQNAEESFKYFWRAILLGCPAAEENLGFFLMARDHYIKNATLEQEVLARTYSCDPVEKTSISDPPYHLKFDAQQCASINYYAQRLVDTSLPFTGKTECAFSSDMGQMADFLSQ